MIALQLVGSPTSKLFFRLSMLYAKEVVKPPGFDLLFAIAHPDSTWSVSEKLPRVSKKLSFEEMISQVREADIAVPHMFCHKGLTSIRIIFEDILNIPVVGSPGHTAAISQDKFLTKTICENAGILVPNGQLIKISDQNDTAQMLDFPVIVKPNSADNSDGLSLVQDKKEYQTALEKCAQFGNEILVETYIPGREIRAAILYMDGKFIVPSFIEYGVNEKRPIRYAEDKLKFDDGQLISQSDKKMVPSVCPAKINKDLKNELTKIMKKAHLALHCRDFSMYDFRIHDKTNKPYILETGLFWSFSKTSMISKMLASDNQDLKTITQRIWLNAYSRRSER